MRTFIAPNGTDKIDVSPFDGYDFKDMVATEARTRYLKLFRDVYERVGSDIPFVVVLDNLGWSEEKKI